MSDELSIIVDELLALPLEEALSSADARECHAYSRVFLERARQCDGNDDTAGAKGWSLLFRLTQLRLHARCESDPFLSMIPSDFRGERADAVHSFALQVQDSELRARLLDVVWESSRIYTAAEAAIRAYLESGKRLLDPDHWIAYVDRCERALRLAALLGHDELRDVVVSEIECTVVALKGEDSLFLTIRLVSLLLEFRSGDLGTLSAISDKAASLAEDSMEFDKARSHLENLEVCRRRLEDTDGERFARSRIAGCLERQGVLHLESGEPMHAAHWLEKAHVVYRETPGMRDKAGDVYVLLRTAQRDAANSMTTLDLPPMDVTEQMEMARTYVAGYGFPEAFWRLLNIMPTTDFEDAERATAEMLEGTVWWRLVPVVSSERDGRVVARSMPPDLDGPDNEQPVPWEQVVKSVAMNQQILGHTVIQPAMRQIMLEHVPLLRDVHGFVSHSPLVPFGHEGLFVKGLLSGLRGDMVGALSVLVPQFENGLRHLLGGMGVETSSMDKMGYQDVFQMGRMLSLVELEEVLGTDLVREMRLLFTDRHGPKERDRMSHGLMSSADFYGGSAYYAWWLICRVCFNPVLRRYVQRSDKATDIGSHR